MIGRGVPLLLISLAASGAWSQQSEQRAEPAPAAAASAAAPLFTANQLMFLSHMIVHHEQALEMAGMVPSRSPREDFIRYARYLDGAQRVEIDQMKGLLRMASERGLEIPHHDMTGDPPMSGMLSHVQMAALAAAKGAEFEKLWLQGMIYHHEGGLAMAREQQEQQFELGRQTYGIDVLVDDIIEVQRAEVAKMKNWLTQWGLGS
ncbi:MAG: DUF305 domain-containing protein [Gammaproteobacteria bacterium]